MSLVVDANVALALVLPLPYSAHAEQLWSTWQQRGEVVYAPTLWGYEVTSALRKAIALANLPTAHAERSLETLLALGVELIPPTVDLHRAALRWAERLQQTVAYDAHYLALAEALGCPFWTADQRLSEAAREHAPWVRWIGEASTG